MKGRCVIGSLARVMRGRNVSMEVKKSFKKEYSHANIEIWIRLKHGIGHSSRLMPFSIAFSLIYDT